MLFGALEAGKQVTCYNFCLDDRTTRDRRVARETASIMNVPLVEIDLHPTVEELKAYLLNLYDFYGKHWKISKSTTECMWPLFRTFECIKERSILLGFGPDPIFATNRKTLAHIKRGGSHQDTLDHHFTHVFSKKSLQEVILNRWLRLEKTDTLLYTPYQVPPIDRIFHGFDPIAGNKPIQKAPIRLAFWEYFQKTNPMIHINFNSGDNGINEVFNVLLSTDWNIGNWKSAVGIYNALSSGSIQEMLNTQSRKTLFK